MNPPESTAQDASRDQAVGSAEAREETTAPASAQDATAQRPRADAPPPGSQPLSSVDAPDLLGPAETTSQPGVDPVDPSEVDAPPAEAAVATPPSVEQPPQQPEPGPRRVRLNPTIGAEAARPIPSLLTPSATPPPADSPSAPASPPVQTPVPIADADGSSVDEAVTTDSGADAGTDASRVDTVSEVEAPPADESASAEPVAAPEPVEIPTSDALDTALEAELDAALSGGESTSVVAPAEVDAETPAVPDAERVVKKGMRVKGTVQSIHGDDMFVELGHRLPGVLSRRQFGLKKQPMQGEPIEVVIGKIDEREGLIHCNLPRGTSRPGGNWDEITAGQTVECMVMRTNKGGLEVNVGSLRGFMPASQVDLGFVPDLEAYVGQKLRAKVAEVKPKRRKLVLSRRTLLEEERAQSEQEAFQKLAPGQTFTGRVKTIKDYGAFVDIGGVDGLLHVGQISWNRINHPSDVLSEGQEVEVQVLSVDPDKKKIGLGMRQLTQNPWANVEQKYASGAVVRGKVTRTENFGAFIELEPGLEGLVHISELDHKRVNRVTEVLNVGQEVDVKVLDVDPKRRRIGLSVKALIELPEQAESAPDQPRPRQRKRESLKGGMGEPTGGKLFGDPRKFGG